MAERKSLDIKTKFKIALILILRRLNNISVRIRFRAAHQELRRKKFHQVKIFNELKKDFLPLYEKVSKQDISSYVTPLWEKFNEDTKRAFLPFPSFSFLNNSTIMFTMFGGRPLLNELKYLEENESKPKLKELLEEDYVGDPLLCSSTYITSLNSVVQLYHLMVYMKKANVDITKIKNIVEWGGGYGNLAKIIFKLKKNLCTYVIIDTPLFSCLQWLYLSTAVGKRYVHILTSNQDAVLGNKINLVPLSYLDKTSIRGDLFLSMWGLSESSKFSQDYVISTNWFSANHIFVGFQGSSDDLPDSGRVGELARKKGAFIERMPFVPNNYYALM